MKILHIAGVLLLANVLAIENSKKTLTNKLGYNPAELLAHIFNTNSHTETKASRYYDPIKFEKDFDDNSLNGEQRTKKRNSKIKFEDENDYQIDDDLEIPTDTNSKLENNVSSRLNSIVVFPRSNDDSILDNFEDNDEARSKYKRRKNKRKLRVQSDFSPIPNHGHINGNVAGINTNTHLLPVGPNFGPNTRNQYGLLAGQYPYPAGVSPLETGPTYGFHDHYVYGAAGQYPGKVNPFIPRGIASDALAAVVDAFTSVARNDDYQCVPRLLCETSGGAVGSNKILDSVSNLQPLFSMLANYQGISTSPLFLFGRAVILGMSSKGNPSSCRYAYPQCPNDPDDLVHYLNNHKGGFFRFFSNIKANSNLGEEQNQHYGIYQPSRINENNYGNGLYNDNKVYGENYVYGERNQNNGIKTNSHERIQNKPTNAVNDFNENTKWLFPDDVNYEDNIRVVKELKFPANDNIENNFDDIRHNKRRGKTITFPERNKGNSYVIKFNADIDSLNELNNYHRYANKEENDYVFDYVHKFYVKREKKKINTPEEENLNTVYIVRGNGDPRHPEVVKLRPGESIQ